MAGRYLSMFSSEKIDESHWGVSPAGRVAELVSADRKRTLKHCISPSNRSC